MGMKERVEALEQLRAKKADLGGAERVARQRGRNKLDARARLALLFDPGTVQELGGLAAAEGRLPEEEDASRPTPADGVLTAIGQVAGRPVAAAIYDFTVLGGSIGEVGERKVTRLRDLALKEPDSPWCGWWTRPALGWRQARSTRDGWPASPTRATSSASSRCCRAWCPRWPRCWAPARPARRTSPASLTTCRW